MKNRLLSGRQRRFLNKVIPKNLNHMEEAVFRYK